MPVLRPGVCDLSATIAQKKSPEFLPSLRFLLLNIPPVFPQSITPFVKIRGIRVNLLGVGQKNKRRPSERRLSVL
jgi:hypothetical protein